MPRGVKIGIRCYSWIYVYSLSDNHLSRSTSAQPARYENPLAVVHMLFHKRVKHSAIQSLVLKEVLAVRYVVSEASKSGRRRFGGLTFWASTLN